MTSANETQVLSNRDDLGKRSTTKTMSAVTEKELVAWKLSSQEWREEASGWSEILGAKVKQSALERGMSTEAIEAAERTNGLEHVVDWPVLEESLKAGEYAHKTDFWDVVRNQFKDKGFFLKPSDRRTYREVVLGLFPDYRDMYTALPYGSEKAKA